MKDTRVQHKFDYFTILHVIIFNIANIYVLSQSNSIVLPEICLNADIPLLEPRPFCPIRSLTLAKDWNHFFRPSNAPIIFPVMFQRLITLLFFVLRQFYLFLIFFWLFYNDLTDLTLKKSIFRPNNSGKQLYYLFQ